MKVQNTVLSRSGLSHCATLYKYCLIFIQRPVLSNTVVFIFWIWILLSRHTTIGCIFVVVGGSQHNIHSSRVDRQRLFEGMTWQWQLLCYFLTTGSYWSPGIEVRQIVPTSNFTGLLSSDMLVIRKSTQALTNSSGVSNFITAKASKMKALL